ncbi:hypothetical protein RRG08_054293, partial [Elysia crispata]
MTFCWFSCALYRMVCQAALRHPENSTSRFTEATSSLTFDPATQ